MARGRNSKSEKEESAAGSLEVGMLCKSAFNDSELESYLRQGEIKASEKPPVPPQVLWVGDCTIATFGNFSASTGKAKSKKTFNITAMVAAALTNSTVLNYRASFPEGKRQILYFTTRKESVDELRRLCGKKDFRVRNVMIMGGGRISVRLAHIASDKFNLTIIENDLDLCRSLPEQCAGAKVNIIHGDARNNDTLREEGISDMDAFVALTEFSETNILACLTAKEFGVDKTVAEVENIQFISEAEGLNIGTVINKKLLASSKIFQILLAEDESSAKFMALADAEVAEIEARPGSKITSAPVMELKLFREMTLAGLIRDGHGMLVTGRTQILPGDHVLVFSLSGAIHKVEKLFN